MTPLGGEGLPANEGSPRVHGRFIQDGRLLQLLRDGSVDAYVEFVNVTRLILCTGMLSIDAVTG